MARPAYNVPRKKLFAAFITLTFSCLIAEISTEQTYDQSVDLDQNFRLLWTVREPDIIFEVQVRTHGYIGFGFSRDRTIYGADIFIGWIDNGHTFFHDCHIKTHSSTGEPVPDTLQDYVLLSSSENATHTNLRFRRKLNTCDEKFDVPITSDTMNIIYLYHPEKPKRGQIRKGSLSDPVMAMQPIQSLLLLEKTQQKNFNKKVEFNMLEIRNKKVKLSQAPSKILKWCHLHRLQNVSLNQMIRYEPVFASSDSKNFISFMRLYECKALGNDFQLEDDGVCSNSMRIARKCFTVVASWSKGSEGFTYPKDVGYPLDAENFMLEVHYEPVNKRQIEDSSGFRIFHTSNRRKFDAGTLSVGIESNFLHVLAPGFKRVVSVGHCTSNCTQKALPVEGINIFGVNMQTHSLGKKMKIGVVRNGEELAPISQDSNLNSDYIENRVLQKVRKLVPGDHVTVECTYNTYERERFTLGGESDDEEVCTATLMYYPRQEQLVSCTSQTSVANLLMALGIEKLSKSGDQPVITSPAKYAGRTLERHLQLYDWRNEYEKFDRQIKASSFEGVCSSAFVTSRVSGTPANILKPFSTFDTTCPMQDIYSNSVYKFTEPKSNDINIEDDDSDDNSRNKVTRHSPTYSLGLSSSSSQKPISYLPLLLPIARLVFNRRYFTT